MKTNKKLKLSVETMKVLTQAPATCSVHPTTTVQTSKLSRCC